LILLVSSEQFEKFVRSAREKFSGSGVFFFGFFIRRSGCVSAAFWLDFILFYFSVPVSL